ncbi:MAG: class I SAM-dependent DNA methyltransferase [Limnochordia bacterium]
MNSCSAPYTALAPFYDRIETGYDYERGIDVVLELHQRLTGSSPPRFGILDLGCGTGRAMAVLTERGHSTSGVDRSAEMLAVAAQRLSNPGSVPMLICQDMRRLDLGSSRFDLAVALCGSFNYLRSVGELSTTLERIASFLAPRGILAFDIVTEESLASHHGLNPCVVEGSDFMLVWNKVWELQTGLWRFQLDLFVRNDQRTNGRHLWARHREIHRLNSFRPEEVTNALRGAGFGKVTGPLAAFSHAAADSSAERIFYAAQLT